MSFIKIEKGLLDGELWSLYQSTKLPEHLQLLVDKEQRECDDIWELPSKNKVKKCIYPSSNHDSSHSTTV